MQSGPLFQTTLRLAGYMAAKACIALREGRAPGVDYGEVSSDGAARAEALRAGASPAAALLHGRAQLQAKLLGVRAQVLLHETSAQVEGSRCDRLLVAEFDDAAGRLAGLAIALPFRREPAPRLLAIEPARVLCGPVALRPLYDELLRAFAQGIAAMPPGHLAWLQSLALDSERPPEPPAEARDAQALALAIREDDPGRDSDAKAAAHLEALLEHGAFEGGLGFEKALRALPLDLSQASLRPLDELLDRLRAGRHAQPADFLDVQAGANCLHLLAVYLGETVARACGAAATWYTPAQFARAHPSRPQARLDPRSLLCVFDEREGGSGVVFRAQDVVMTRLFGNGRAPGLARAAAEALPAVRARAGAQAGDLAREWNETRTVNDFVIPRPSWVAADPLRAWFDDLPTLMRSGRVVLGRLVQANTRLFEPGDGDHPGDVVYDPGGRTDARRLGEVAQRVFELKGLRPRHPQLRYLADHLTHEHARARGAAVPAGLGAPGLRLSTLLFHRRHLPGGRLGELVFPLLISDAAPGLAAVLPARFWRPELRAGWDAPAAVAEPVAG